MSNSSELIQFNRLLSPAAARIHMKIIIAVRVFQGLFQGLTLPDFYSMIQKWLPELERNKFMQMIIVGIDWSTL